MVVGRQTENGVCARANQERLVRQSLTLLPLSGSYRQGAPEVLEASKMFQKIKTRA